MPSKIPDAVLNCKDAQLVERLRERAQNCRLAGADFFTLPPSVQRALEGIGAELDEAAAALERVEPPPQEHRSERDYIERTIATVRNHRDADNCWPSWANIFADEIEACWAALEAAERERDEWMTPFDGGGAEWHESLPSPYTYKASDFSALVAATHEYEARLLVALAERDAAREALEVLARLPVGLHSDTATVAVLRNEIAARCRLAREALAAGAPQKTQIPETMNLLRYGVTVAPEEDCGCGYEDVPDGSVTRRRWFHAPGCRPANAAGDPREQNPTKGRSDEGDGGWDFPATRKRAGAEATSESVVPPSSEPSPASEHEAVGGSPGAAPVGPPPAPPQESADG